MKQPNHPNQWPDIEPLDMDFDEAIRKMLTLPPEAVDTSDLEEIR